ncbi:MAG TPA: tripartite tricarboxylate transporter substrate binding protein [Xanthobacteraceae bacterium]
MHPQAVLAFVSMALCLGLNAADPAGAQSYPTQPIKIIVPAAAGGPTDIPARLSAQILPPKLGQPVVVENRPGAGGAIGGRDVAKAAPDGYTLLAGGGAMLAVLPAMSKRAGYDPTKDFAAVAKFMDSFQVLVVHPASPWKSVRELADDARANPGKLNYAHVGTGHITHLAGEMFMSRTGASIVGVPYRSGGESVTAVLGHAVDLTFENVAILLPLIRDGKLRALAVTSKSRTALAPDLPTMIEAGVPDYEVTTFFGIVAPAGTPRSIVNTLNTTINDSLKTPEMQETIIKLGAVPQPGSPEDFAATIAAQLEKWRALGKMANINID